VAFIDSKIAVIGLGYVGLPVAIALSKKLDVVGFDIDQRRTDSLRQGRDWTGEVSEAELAVTKLVFTSDIAALKDRNFFIVAVPTPVNAGNSPDLSMLRSACALLGKVMRPGATIVFESTVYPGATEEVCGPALAEASGLVCGVDFKLGYSPERINPGDQTHRLESIVKIVAAQDAEALDKIANVYGQIITAGIYRASSIKVAEAAKVLENTQRDINIALMNEMAKICDLIGIRTADVLDAAGTKWNFLRFTPGLVGGHCIGVDPYYLTAKAEELGYHPEVILAGRRINDSMATYLANRIVRKLAVKGLPVHGARAGILGITFKEAVPDIRNSKVADLYKALADFGVEPLVSDPRADPDETYHEYGIKLADAEQWDELDVLILAVPHPEYATGMVERIARSVRNGGIVVDLKSVVDAAAIRPDLAYISL
jgi:UDP-N-acetyl-D-glucosamine/UDP-N-acetyl-D-galactosamine dehydrogenase